MSNVRKFPIAVSISAPQSVFFCEGHPQMTVERRVRKDTPFQSPFVLESGFPVVQSHNKNAASEFSVTEDNYHVFLIT